MIATLLARKDAGSKRPAQDDWFETYTPPHTAAATRAALSVQKVVRSQMIGAWLAQLPLPARPLRLAAQSPDIVLMIMERWANPSAALIFLDELVLNERLDARWRDPEIFAEVGRLASFVRHAKRSATDGASGVATDVRALF